MYAVVKTGGKQYRVSPGDVLIVEKILGQTGAKVKLEDVLMVGEDGKKPEIGTPMLGGSAVNCEVLDQGRADKVIVFKRSGAKIISAPGDTARIRQCSASSTSTARAL